METQIYRQPLNEEYTMEIFKGTVTEPEQHEGITICDKCGAKYAGMQDRCTNLVPHHSFVSVYGGYRTIRFGEKTYVGEVPLKSQTKYLECNSYISYRWSLNEAKERYYRFKDFQQSLKLYITHVKEFKEFKDLVNPEALEAIKETLPERTVLLERKVEDIIQAINQIATRMDNAGAQLQSIFYR